MQEESFGEPLYGLEHIWSPLPQSGIDSDEFRAIWHLSRYVGLTFHLCGATCVGYHE